MAILNIRSETNRTEILLEIQGAETYSEKLQLGFTKLFQVIRSGI